MLSTGACAGEGQREPADTLAAPTVSSQETATEASPSDQGTAVGTGITLYSTPTCGCCREYASYLEGHGFQVETVFREDLSPIKDDLGVPEEMRSCHTAVIGDYFVEGHVPVEAIWKLLREQPEIDGIALPGMPSGSPGMSGEKEEPFVIYSVAKGRVEVFMTQ